jgi:hypothetical protein
MPKSVSKSVSKSIKPSKLLKASTLLTEAASLAEFAQAFAVNAEAGEDLWLTPEQVTGMYYALGDIADRIRKADRIVMS